MPRAGFVARYPRVGGSVAVGEVCPQWCRRRLPTPAALENVNKLPPLAPKAPPLPTRWSEDAAYMLLPISRARASAHASEPCRERRR
jgi:hypothetical protein